MKQHINQNILYTAAFLLTLTLIASTFADEEVASSEEVKTPAVVAISDEVKKTAPELPQDLDTANTFGFGRSFGGNGYRGRHFYGGIKIFGGIGRNYAHRNYNHGYYYYPRNYGHHYNYYPRSHYYGGYIPYQYGHRHYQNPGYSYGQYG